jgi:hypothetical protein
VDGLPPPTPDLEPGRLESSKGAMSISGLFLFSPASISPEACVGESWLLLADTSELVLTPSPGYQ